MTPDQPISLAIAIAGSGLSLLLPRKWALAPLAISIVIHPSTLLVPPPQLSLTAQRVIAIVLFARCIFSPAIRSQFRWRLVDTAAAAYFLLLVISQVMTTPIGPALNNRAGFFLSALLPFWCARLLITDRHALYALLKAMLWAALPLAFLGLHEMQTAYNPWDKIREFGIIKAPRGSDGFRIFMGQQHARARGPFVQYIMFGWFFALLMALGTNLYLERKRLGLWTVPWLALPLGVISSIASGPMVLAGLSLGLLLLFPLRHLWRIGTGAFLALYAGFGLFSNRSLMEHVANYGFDPESSWYRYRLVRFTLEQGGMRGHWFMGYGEIPPNYIEYHDLCIHWVWLLVVHGIAGWVGFYCLIAAVAWALWQAKRKASSAEDQWLLWTMTATIAASLAAMLVVALFSETYHLYHLLLGIIANAPLLVRQPESAVRQVGILAQLDGKPVLLRYHLKPGQKLALVRPALHPEEETTTTRSTTSSFRSKP